MSVVVGPLVVVLGLLALVGSTVAGVYLFVRLNRRGPGSSGMQAAVVVAVVVAVAALAVVGIGAAGLLVMSSGSSVSVDPAPQPAPPTPDDPVSP